MPPYRELYPIGSVVQIADRKALEHFHHTWHYHHPLTDEQLMLAGRTAQVKDVGFYHGGDVLYRLDGLAGTWHEACLHPTANGGAG